MTTRPLTTPLLLAAALTLLAAQATAQTEYPATANGPLPADTGFRGIWYANQPSGDEYRYKYSGGLATYPQQHAPIAIYRPEVNKTFFVYGGRYPDRNRLLHSVAFYDHDTNRLSRPRILLDKQTDDAHDNPTLLIDPAGHLYIFSNAHGTSRPAYIHRSTEPYAIDRFHLLRTTNFSYGQPRWVEGHGMILLHTLYRGGRQLHISRSTNGRDWSEPRLLANTAEGHYQLSAHREGRLATLFNVHPEVTGESGLNFRTNLYYLYSDDGGDTWHNARGQPVTLPVDAFDHPSLALDYRSANRLVYLKDLRLDRNGYPVALYLTSNGYESGPKSDPRILTLSRFDGRTWHTTEITTCDNNYDFASLYLEPDGTWRIIGTTQPGPQRYNTGGELAMWTSTDRGVTWTMANQLTRDSEFNHNYPRRPVNAHPDFYALWADGHARQPSESRLYFTTQDGQVFQLPTQITTDTAAPIPLNP